MVKRYLWKTAKGRWRGVPGEEVRFQTLRRGTNVQRPREALSPGQDAADAAEGLRRGLSSKDPTSDSRRGTVISAKPDSAA